MLKHLYTLILKLVYSAMIILPLTILPACGGGGGGGDETPTDDNSSDNTDDGSTTDDTDSGQTNIRVSRIRYDFDNNGVFEGTREYTYDTDGRIIEERYSYIDDGTEDTELAGTLSNSIALDPIDETITYTYDADGRLQTWVGVTSESRDTSIYTFNDDNLITQVDVTMEDETGAVTSQYSHTLSYSEQRLIRHTMTLDNEVTPMQEYEIGYDDSGYVITNQQTMTSSNQVSHQTYTYLTNGRPNTIVDTSPSLPDYRRTYEFGYTANNQPAYMNNIAEGIFSDRYGWLFQYDDNGQKITTQIDEAIDGTIDAVAEIEWEEGVCTSVLSWYPRTIVTDTVDLSSPYKPGTGYVWLPHCTSGM
ncbi:MAG: hypothetical protein ABW104_18260 [Candidatus Thiodiazotropha sp. 6PLUC2]